MKKISQEDIDRLIRSKGLAKSIASRIIEEEKAPQPSLLIAAGAKEKPSKRETKYFDKDFLPEYGYSRGMSLIIEEYEEGTLFSFRLKPLKDKKQKPLSLKLLIETSDSVDELPALILDERDEEGMFRLKIEKVVRIEDCEIRIDFEEIA